jgi:F-type H+-transporting ATPase subunit epsilon
MAAAEQLSLEIVTPTGLALSLEVDEVRARSVQGEFGVLPGHLPMLAALDIGLLHYRQGDSETEVAVGTGFVEILKDRALVLTDRYITRDQVDVLAVRERLEQVDAELDKWQGDPDAAERLNLIEEEQWLAAQLEVFGDPAPPRVLVETRSTDYRNIIPDAETAADGDATDADDASSAGD